MSVLGDFDIWYLPCEHCGYDTGKSTSLKCGVKRCWRCGRPIKRDFTDRALKKKTLLHTTGNICSPSAH